MPVRVRIAPSPTGDPHVGTAYIALFNYVFAKQQSGQFILRIEDTDQARSKPAWETMIVEALRWLGITWDEGPDIGGPHAPYRQSERGDIYRRHAQVLVDKGAAYPCFCAPERLEELRKEQRQRKANPGYDGRCRKLTAGEAAALRSRGAPHTIRLKVPHEGATTFKDELRGPVSFENVQIDDQVLLKSDGLPTYHLANVVDDRLMEITHVMRAEEWVTSTPKHVLLYAAFGWQEPVWIHMPLLRNPDKSKISKRRNPVSLNYYRDAGFYAEAMLNYLGMMGWTMPDGREKFSLADMVASFTLERISLGGPVFDLAKLTWLNGLYIRDEPVERLAQRLRDTVFSLTQLRAVAPLVHARINKLEDFVDLAHFFFNGDVGWDREARAALVLKDRSPKESAKLLEAILEIIDATPRLEAGEIEAKLRALADTSGNQAQELFMLLRAAVTGRTATPPLFETMAVLGKERCRRRLKAAVNELSHGQTVDQAKGRASER
ncbi:MAG: glutamate--tRNA ligase [Deltaproteobacteria bacterium]|nr:glutamate--tRNA ligase [Deltaproteobacteria bacterium]